VIENKQYVACAHCDLLLDAPVLQQDQFSACPRCGHKISRLRKSLMAQLLAFGVTALMLLVLSSCFSLMTMNIGGNISDISLWQSALNLYFDQYKVLSLIVFVLVVLIPAMVVSLILFFVLMIRINVRPKMLSNILRLIFGLLPWAMAEVFLVGVLVSLVKLVTISQIELGFSFWTYALFCICYAKVLSLLDRYQLWSWLSNGYRHA